MIIGYREPLCLLLIILMLGAYAAYRAMYPLSPKRHKWFIGAAFAAGLIGGLAEGVFLPDPRIEWPNFIILYLAFSGISFVVYRFIQRATESRRVQLTLFVLFSIGIALSWDVYLMHREVTELRCASVREYRGVAGWHIDPPTPLQKLFHTPTYRLCKLQPGGHGLAPAE